MSADRRPSVPTPASGTSSLPPGFTDEVMRAIDQAPRPSPGRAFWYAVRDRSIADARGALSVAWRIIRRSTSMPVMVRAQALALVVVVAGSMVGGGVLAAVVAYRTVGPIVHAISEPPGDRARTVHEAPTPPSPAPLETPSTVEAVEPEVGGPDRPPTRPATTGGSNLPGDRADEDGDDVDEPDGGEPDGTDDDGDDADEADDPGADTDEDAADGDDVDEADGADEGGDPDEVESP